MKNGCNTGAFSHRDAVSTVYLLLREGPCWSISSGMWGARWCHHCHWLLRERRWGNLFAILVIFASIQVVSIVIVVFLVAGKSRHRVGGGFGPRPDCRPQCGSKSASTNVFAALGLLLLKQPLQGSLLARLELGQPQLVRIRDGRQTRSALRRQTDFGYGCKASGLVIYHLEGRGHTLPEAEKDREKKTIISLPLGTHATLPKQTPAHRILKRGLTHATVMTVLGTRRGPSTEHHALHIAHGWSSLHHRASDGFLSRCNRLRWEHPLFGSHCTQWHFPPWPAGILRRSHPNCHRPCRTMWPS
jgi:hypothetical protein